MPIHGKWTGAGPAETLYIACESSGSAKTPGTFRRIQGNPQKPQEDLENRCRSMGNRPGRALQKSFILLVNPADPQEIYQKSKKISREFGEIQEIRRKFREIWATPCRSMGNGPGRALLKPFILLVNPADLKKSREIQENPGKSAESPGKSEKIHADPWEMGRAGPCRDPLYCM